MDQNSATVNPAAQAASGVDDLAGTIAPADNVPLAKQTEEVKDDIAPNANVLAQVAEKISAAQNVLVALSSDPSVDEMAAAIGLTIFLDKLGKRATAIYSGVTPNALEFLKPEKTFESSADTLQDFVVALNKEKADHLRYRLDGDYVKIYITPYRTRISEKDLGFSYGDYNVDLVIALDVTNGLDLDAALREHGRIMHDAMLINITTANPGKFGGIEWSDKTASSVSEMIAKLIYSANSSVKIGKEEATAFLTGIVAATNRFSNAKTTPVTMQIASKLMDSGANQQLVSKNITPDVENEVYSVGDGVNAVKQVDATQLKINHSDTSDERISSQNGPAESDGVGSGEAEVNNAEEPVDSNDAGAVSDVDSAAGDFGTGETTEEIAGENVGPIDSAEGDAAVAGVDTNGAVVNENPVATDTSTVVADENADVAGTDATVAEGTSTLLDDLKAAEESLAQAGNEIVPDLGNRPLKINEAAGAVGVEGDSGAMQGAMPASATFEASEPVQTVESSNVGSIQPEVVASPAEPVLPPVMQSDTVSTDADSVSQPVVPGQGEGIYNKPEKVVQPPEGMSSGMPDGDPSKYGKMLESALGGDVNPASAMAPEVSSAPEINGVPEMNYMPLPGQEVLPPPPTPPIDMNGTGDMADTGAFVPPVTPPAMGTAAASVASDGMPSATIPQPTSLGQQPAMQDQVYNPQAADPGAFKIPGM